MDESRMEEGSTAGQTEDGSTAGQTEDGSFARQTEDGSITESQMDDRSVGNEETNVRNGPRNTSLPSVEWLDRSHVHNLRVDQDRYELELVDTKEDLVQTDDDVRRVLSLLEQQKKLHLSEKQLDALRDARLKGDEHVFAGWNEHHHDKNYSEDEEERVKDFDQNHRLEVLWNERPKWVNYLLAFSFHLVVLINFLYCLWESYGILMEDAKFDVLYLKDIYQCLKVVPSHDSVSHFVSIFHAITCVAVLHAKTLQTANLCWAFLIGTSLHSCFKVYEMLFNSRFEYDEPIRGFLHWRLIQLIVVLIIQLLAVIVILQRYYDLTARFQKRTHKFVTQTYEGRQLNDRIIYRNVSSFVQRKYVLRSCTALQIYNTVQKMQVYKKKLKKGEQVGEEVFNRDIRAAVVALKEVQGFKGMDMMKELKRRHYENIREEYEMGDPGTQMDDGNDERIEEILEEIKDVV